MVMEILVRRIAKRETYTIGRLYVNGAYFCDTIEDKDRGLRQDMPVSVIRQLKVYGETAIPRGEYKVLMNQPSPKYQEKAKKDKFYATYCDHMPRIDNVKGYSGVLIHPGSDEKDTLGCLLVGENKVVGKVINSRSTFAKLYDLMYEAYRDGETIYLTIE